MLKSVDYMTISLKLSRS